MLYMMNDLSMMGHGCWSDDDQGEFVYSPVLRDDMLKYSNPCEEDVVEIPLPIIRILIRDAEQTIGIVEIIWIVAWVRGAGVTPTLSPNRIVGRVIRRAARCRPSLISHHRSFADLIGIDKAASVDSIADRCVVDPIDRAVDVGWLAATVIELSHEQLQANNTADNKEEDPKDGNVFEHRQ